MTRVAPWAELPDGGTVERFTLADDAGFEVDILSYGATIAAARVPDRHGEPRNVVLGLPNLGGYAASTDRLGAVVGRYGNRIAGARFTLDGKTYHLDANDGPNTLHGGGVGYEKRLWRVAGSDENSLDLALTSPDGDQGFPGEAAIAVRYAVETSGTLSIAYTARTSQPTVVNLTNHAYFNLAGENSGEMLNQVLEIEAERLVAIDPASIPSGELMEVAGTPFDFTRPERIGARICEPHEQIVHGRGYDHCWALREGPSAEPRRAAQLIDPGSGRSLTISTTQPGIQFYSGNFLNGTLVGSGSRVYRQSAGLALETQHFPDSPNHPEFPSTVLRPGEVYRTVTLLHFGADG